MTLPARVVVEASGLLAAAIEYSALCPLPAVGAAMLTESARYAHSTPHPERLFAERTARTHRGTPRSTCD